MALKKTVEVDPSTGKVKEVYYKPVVGGFKRYYTREVRPSEIRAGKYRAEIEAAKKAPVPVKVPAPSVKKEPIKLPAPVKVPVSRIIREKPAPGKVLPFMKITIAGEEPPPKKIIPKKIQISRLIEIKPKKKERYRVPTTEEAISRLVKRGRAVYRRVEKVQKPIEIGIEKMRRKAREPGVVGESTRTAQEIIKHTMTTPFGFELMKSPFLETKVVKKVPPVKREKWLRKTLEVKPERYRVREVKPGKWGPWLQAEILKYGIEMRLLDIPLRKAEKLIRAKIAKMRAKEIQLARRKAAIEILPPKTMREAKFKLITKEIPKVKKRPPISIEEVIELPTRKKIRKIIKPIYGKKPLTLAEARKLAKKTKAPPPTGVTGERIVYDVVRRKDGTVQLQKMIVREKERKVKTLLQEQWERALFGKKAKRRLIEEEIVPLVYPKAAPPALIPPTIVREKVRFLPVPSVRPREKLIAEEILKVARKEKILQIERQLTPQMMKDIVIEKPAEVTVEEQITGIVSRPRKRRPPLEKPFVFIPPPPAPVPFEPRRPPPTRKPRPRIPREPRIPDITFPEFEKPRKRKKVKEPDWFYYEKFWRIEEPEKFLRGIVGNRKKKKSRSNINKIMGVFK